MTKIYPASKSYIMVNVSYKIQVCDLAVEHYFASRLVYSKTCLKLPLKNKTKNWVSKSIIA